MKTESQPANGGRSARKIGAFLLATTAMCGAYQPLMAQTAGADAAQSSDPEIVVEGIRATIQSSISAKREATTISDSLNSTEIGNLPATSVGEAIETITGASTHREKGGATEISIRGLGPFLGTSTFNGREASNGSGDRSVNFNQFPSELINGITIYKTQQANLIEGAVSGLIELQTLRPIDYGKRRIQIDFKGDYSPHEQRITDGDKFGYRGTISYVDQFDIGGGRWGISLGFQRNKTNNPEEVFSGSSTWVTCDPVNLSSSSSNCNSVSNDDAAAGAPFFLSPSSSRTLRQISDSDKRNAYFGALQWQPSDRLDINLDFQKSRRTFVEIRQDLNFSEIRRGIANPVYDANGVIQSYSANTSIESTPTYRVQTEDYEGGGFNIAWNATDTLTLRGDASYSKTYRQQMDRSVRLRTDARDIFNAVTPVNNQRIPYTFDATNGVLPTITVDPRFDLNDWTLFSDDARLRRDEQVHNNEVKALRFDATLELNNGFFSQLDAGTRLSRVTYSDYDDRVEITQDDRAVDAAANIACRQDFPQRDFLSGVSGNTINSWATFDPLCLYQQYLGTEDPGRNADIRAIGNNDITETTWSGYVMASYESSVGHVPISGNFGVRVVNTQDESLGLRSDIRVINNSDGSISLTETGAFTTTLVKNEYTRILPSWNLSADVSDDLKLRLGIFRAMSRPDPADLGAGRSIQLASGASFDNLQDAISQITASGSPGLTPLMSWNFDASLELYPNKDSILSVAGYYKVFEGGFVNVVNNETFVIDGNSVVVPVVQQANGGDTSHIYGVEITAATRFSFLPGPLAGLGTKISYNYAKTNFETQDINLGIQTDAVTGAVTPGIIPPANIFGLSKHVLSAQLYWELGPIDLQAIYKYRSNYYQKFTGGPSQLRYVGGTEVVDLRASLKITDNVSFRIEAINLFDRPKVTYMPVQGSVREYNGYGAKYFAGFRVKF